MRNTHSPSPPILLRARGSETGSIFHEDVWPPPAETSRLVDPIVQASSQVDLSSIVDDVMGPPDPHISARPNRNSFFANNDHDDDTDMDGESVSTPYIFIPPNLPRQSIPSSIRTSTTSSYDYAYPGASNTSQMHLWSSESTSSFSQQAYPRHASPLRHSLDASSSDRTSHRDSRLWIDRSPTRRMSRLGTDSS